MSDSRVMESNIGTQSTPKSVAYTLNISVLETTWEDGSAEKTTRTSHERYLVHFLVNSRRVRHKEDERRHRFVVGCM